MLIHHPDLQTLTRLSTYRALYFLNWHWAGIGRKSCSAISSTMDVIPRILGWEKGLSGIGTSRMSQVTLQNEELNPPTPHWNFFLFCSDIWYKNNKNEITIYGQAGTSIISETDHTGWTQTDLLSRANISPKNRPSATLNPLLPLRNFSQRGGKDSASVVFLRQRFLFDSGSSRVKTCKRGSTTLWLASLFKLKPRKPQGLNFCHCNLVLLWGTHTDTHAHKTHNLCKYNVFSLEELKLSASTMDLTRGGSPVCVCTCMCVCVL